MRERFEALLATVSYPTFSFQVGKDESRFYMQIACNDGTCNVTGKTWAWKSRKWFLSAHMTDSEVVQTAFLAVKTAAEHEMRENFKYRGRAIFQPHYDIDELWYLCIPENEDRRDENS